MFRKIRASTNLQSQAFQPWTNIVGAEFNAVKVGQLPGRGNAIVASESIPDQYDKALITVPRSIVLSFEYVQQHAKSDALFRALLDALGEYGRSTRGAVLAFLLQQTLYLLLQHERPAEAKNVGLSTEWATYIGFLPENVLATASPLSPLVDGTSFALAMDAKMNSLRREFATFKKASTVVPWCASYWSGQDLSSQEQPTQYATAVPSFGLEQKELYDDGDYEFDNEAGMLSFDDWLQVDFLYRSRGLEIPGLGECLVPCIDMVNHNGAAANAFYECNDHGDVELLLRPGKGLAAGQEVTISYGDDKSACEMLFSYGFIPEEMLSHDARVVVLDLPIPEDDPLGRAKKFTSTTTPGLTVSSLQSQARPDNVSCTSDFIWCLVVNEEDGLGFEVLQTIDGGRELKAFWKSEEIENVDTALLPRLQQDHLWPVYQLRANVLMQHQVQAQLDALTVSQNTFDDSKESVKSIMTRNLLNLRELEMRLLVKGLLTLEQQQKVLLDLPEVQGYLARQQNLEDIHNNRSAGELSTPAGDNEEDEDFS